MAEIVLEVLFDLLLHELFGLEYTLVNRVEEDKEHVDVEWPIEQLIPLLDWFGCVLNKPGYEEILLDSIILVAFLAAVNRHHLTVP